MPLFLIALLLFTNPKDFKYIESKEMANNRAINQIERVLQRVEANIFGYSGRI